MSRAIPSVSFASTRKERWAIFLSLADCQSTPTDFSLLAEFHPSPSFALSSPEGSPLV